MKKLLILLTLTIGLAMTAQTTTPYFKNIKLSTVPLGSTNDSIVMWNGMTKLFKHLPASQLKMVTNLDATASSTGVTVFSSTGNDAVLPLATTANAGLLSPIDKVKLDSLGAGGSPLQINADWNSDSGVSQILNKPIERGWFFCQLTQTGTNIPVFNAYRYGEVLNLYPTLIRESEGVYKLEFAGAYDWLNAGNYQTYINIESLDKDSGYISAKVSGGKEITIKTRNSAGTLSDNILNITGFYLKRYFTQGE